jgi:hypothetical protein
MNKKPFIILLFISGWLIIASAIQGKIALPSSKLATPLILAQNDEFETDNLADQTKSELNGSPRRISKSKAVLLSLLVPGAGQFYADARGRAEVFIGAELSIWIGYFAFRTYGKWKENDYIRYATRHAGVDPSGKDDEYYKNLTFYNNLEEYNRSGRIIDPEGPYYLPGTNYDWYWESDAHRVNYRSMRNSSETAFRNASFMIGLALINRLLSGIDAYRLAKKNASEIEDNFFSKNNIDIDFSASPFGENPRFKFAVKRSF